MPKSSAKHQKKLVLGFVGSLLMRTSSAHQSGACLCKSMVQPGGQVLDVTTFVLEQAVSGQNLRTVYCEGCGQEVATLLMHHIMTMWAEDKLGPRTVGIPLP
jgi:hypothetical protein